MGRPLVVNMFAGPGAGKSTTATGVFSRLKILGYNAEYVSEYAKDLTWARRSLANQVLILGKQYDRLFRLNDQVEVIVTDSPLLLTCIYNQGHDSLNRLAVDLFAEFDNLNLFIERVKAYNPQGRNQSESESMAIDARVRQLLRTYQVPSYTVKGDVLGIEEATVRAADELCKRQGLETAMPVSEA